MSIFSYVENRSRGILTPPVDSVYQSMYMHIKRRMTCSVGNNSIGGIYNLEFSPNGSILVAACEKKSIQLFDTVACKLYANVPEAHSDCVNCVKFLDDRIFATSSDDCSVRIWDLRNLKSRVRKLNGHKSWVKNIEYSKKDNLLVTSGLDGSIYMWDLDQQRFQKIFHTPGLMRCRISGDDSKMVICTTGGYLITVNDLNLTTLAQDLKGFRPNIHRLMQLGDQYFPIVSEFKHVFDVRRKRNRVELISDFPEKNEAEVICSLAIHPHNWVAVSRNMNADEQAEWTCVHDIQEMADPYQHQPKQSKQSGPGASGSSSSSSSKGDAASSSAFAEQEDEYDAAKKRIADQFAELRQTVLDHLKKSSETSWVATSNRAKQYLKKVNRFLTLLGSPNATPALPLESSTAFDIWSGQVSDNRASNSRSVPVLLRSGLITGQVVHPEDSDDDLAAADDGLYISSSSSDEDDDEEEDRTAEQCDEQENPMAMNVDDPSQSTRRTTRSDINKFYNSIGVRLSKLIDELRAMQKHMNQKYKTNKPRLLYYTSELNQGKGFIKEVCFSNDGRVIASPYANGFRILAFNKQCQELSDCVNSWTEPQKPRQLYTVVWEKNNHPMTVVCAKFCPTYPLLVTGCLRGAIVWHYPRL